MRPILLEFTLGGQDFMLRAYSTFYTLAWVLAPLLGAWVAHRRGLSWRRALALYALALVAGIVGARVFDLFIAGDFYAADPSRIWGLEFAGFSLYGGLLVATLTAIGLTRVWKLPVWRLADSAVPALVLGQVLMRTGCYLNGCCYGTVTHVPWGVTFPAGSYAWAQQAVEMKTGILGLIGGYSEPVHPTQLYEMAGAVLFGLLALWLMRRRRADGSPAVADGIPFLAYALGFTLVRFGNNFLRERQPQITAPEWFYPAFYLLLAAVLVAMIVWRSRRDRAVRLRSDADAQRTVG